MRVAAFAVVLLAAAACTSGTADSRPSPSATPSGSPADRSLVLAVTEDKGGAVSLYRVDAARRAHLMHSLTPPSGFAYSTEVTLSTGPSPVSCVIWRPTSADSPGGGGGEAARCYPHGDRVGHLVPVDGDAEEVALRPDGGAVAWTSLARQGDGYYLLVAAELEDGRPRRPQAFSFQSFEEPAPAPEVPCLDDVGQVVWAGESTLLLQSWGANDDPGGFATMSLTDPTSAGCRDIEQPTHQAADARYTYFNRAAWSDGRSFLALEGEYCEISCPDGKAREASRAVRVDLATGRVLEVIASPAEGRFLTHVTGGSDGVVYVTDALGERRDQRVYLRWPGEKRGQRITGLPRVVTEVVAQP